jgi:hypothetical protein
MRSSIYRTPRMRLLWIPFAPDGVHVLFQLIWILSLAIAMEAWVLGLSCCYTLLYVLDEHYALELGHYKHDGRHHASLMSERVKRSSLVMISVSPPTLNIDTGTSKRGQSAVVTARASSTALVHPASARCYVYRDYCRRAVSLSWSSGHIRRWSSRLPRP